MRTIEEAYLSSNVTATFAKGEDPLTSLGGTGDPKALKTTPGIIRVSKQELELTYMHNPTIFNGINKIVQTIMSAKHEIVAKDKKVKAYFEAFVASLGNSGSDLTWEELLSTIYKYQCLYGDAWIENIFNKKGNRIVDWDIIDPKKMDYAKDSMLRIVLDKFGKPVGYTETLPPNTDVPSNTIPKIFMEKITLPPNGFFIEAKHIAHLKMFTVGDGFYPIGLVEPTYKTSLRKLNIEEALANSIWRHGFPIITAEVGDAQHEPTPQQITSILEKIKNVSNKQELAVPYYYNIKILESKKAEKLSQSLEYFREQEIAALGIPKPFATGGGDATNRATLGNQTSMFQLTLRDIIDKTIEMIRKYMFKPICDLEGFKEVPDLKWDVIGAEELDNKAKRLMSYIKGGILTPEEVRGFIKKVEKLTDEDFEAFKKGNKPKPQKSKSSPKEASGDK